MWQWVHKEGWALKNWCFWIVMLEKILEGPLDWKEIKPVNPKGNQSWIFIGRTDAEVEAPLLWPPDAESTHWKRPRCWERLKAGEGSSEQTLGDGEGQRSLACYSPWGCKESERTYELSNNTSLWNLKYHTYTHALVHKTGWPTCPNHHKLEPKKWEIGLCK